MRYEDIASSAKHAIERIYRWAHIDPVPSNVKAWIHANTKLTNCDEGSGSSASTNVATIPGAIEGIKGVATPYDVAAARVIVSPPSVATTADTINAVPADVRPHVTPTSPKKQLAVIKWASENMLMSSGDANEHRSGGNWNAGAERERSLADSTRDRGREGAAVNQAALSIGNGVRKLTSVEHAKCKQKNSEQAERDRYGTRRHAAAMAELWRAQMPTDEAEAVWQACGGSGVMPVLGYTP